MSRRSDRAPPRPPRSYATIGPIAGLSVAIVLLLVVGGAVLPSGPARSAPRSGPGALIASPETATVTVNDQRTGPSLADYLGVDFRPNEPAGPAATEEVAGASLSYFRFPAGAVADTMDMRSGYDWQNHTQLETDESDFVDWCVSVHCHAILDVPGEIDDPSLAEAIVNYTVGTLGFHPDYWEIGNEPALWTHTGIAWDAWTSEDDRTIDAPGYATLVSHYIAAMRSADPSARFIGLPGVGTGSYDEATWIQDTVTTNQHSLSAVAIHVYPAGDGATGGTLDQFFATLDASNHGSIPGRVPDDLTAIQDGCSKCSVALLADEVGSGSGGGGAWQSYMSGYPEVPYVAAEVVQGIDAGLSNLDVFALRSTYVGSLFAQNGTPYPLDTLYTGVLPHLGPLPLATTTSDLSGLYATATESLDGQNVTLLIVNANSTRALNLSVGGKAFPSDAPWQSWGLSASSRGAVAASGPASPSSWIVAPEGVLLIEEPKHVYPVTFEERGLPTNTRWTVEFAGAPLASTRSSLAASEPNGSYGFSVGDVANWTLSTGAYSGTVVVRGASPSAVVLSFRPFTYIVDFAESGLPAGSRWSVSVDGAAAVGSTNATINVPLANGTHSYAVTSVPGYAVQRAGSFVVSGAGLTVGVGFSTVRFTVVFTESGLPTGDAWGVNLSGSPAFGDSRTVNFSEPNGSYSYEIVDPAGYAASQGNGSVRISGISKTVGLRFTPYPALYAVKFHETGLRKGTNWSVALNGSVEHSDTGTIAFDLPNGSFLYAVAPVPGRNTSAGGSLTVAGAGLSVSIVFVRTYSVVFEEKGLPDGSPWSVDVNGTGTGRSNASSISFSLPNGSYTYSVGPVAGYAGPTGGAFEVGKSAVKVSVVFTKGNGSGSPDRRTTESSPNDTLRGAGILRCDGLRFAERSDFLV